MLDKLQIEAVLYDARKVSFYWYTKYKWSWYVYSWRPLFSPNSLTIACELMKLKFYLNYVFQFLCSSVINSRCCSIFFMYYTCIFSAALYFVLFKAVVQFGTFTSRCLYVMFVGSLNVMLWHAFLTILYRTI